MAAPAIALDAQWGARLQPQDFELRSGDGRTLTVTLRDRAGLVSLTGTYVWILASGPDAADGAEITKTGAVTAGVASITLDDADTDPLDGRYYHEMTVTETSSAAESVVMVGRATIGPDV